MRTDEPQYTARLVRPETSSWKRLLGVQTPYRWNVRRLNLGFTLDVGCGIGRNLDHLQGHGVGVDHNPHSVAIAKSRGLQVFTPDEFRGSPFNAPGRFDSLLLAHVAEHMTKAEVVQLLNTHLPLIRLGGTVTIITPQERGFRADPTHVEFMEFSKLRQIAQETGLLSVKEYSFPFPRWVGRWFTYNEFVSVSMKPKLVSETPR
jgi:SAM-dependent methyltransferase